MISLIAVVAPFLCLPIQRLEKALSVKAQTPLLMRLYAIAILALLVGYGAAFMQIQNGIFPLGIIAMGVVSNLGAAICMLAYGKGKANSIAATFFGVVGALLIAAIAFPEIAVSKIW